MKKNVAFTTLNHVSQNHYSFHFMEEHKPLIESIFILLQKEGAKDIENFPVEFIVDNVDIPKIIV